MKLKVILMGVSLISSAYIANAVDLKRPVFLNIIKSATPEGSFNSKIIFLADQLERNISGNFKQYPVIVTTFSNLDDLDKTNPLGRLIAENLQHELQVRKWKGIDIRIAKGIYIKNSGEFILSRDLDKLKNKDDIKVGSILTGTYQYVGDSLIINAKVIRLSDGMILSSGQIVLPIDAYNFELYEGGMSSISIKGDDIGN